MRFSIGRIQNAWVLALELQDEIREYAYTDKKDVIKHVNRLLESINQEDTDL